MQEERYLLPCLRYIELNPLNAGMVSAPGDYRWPSFRAHAFGVKARLWSPHRHYLDLGDGWKQRQRAWRSLVSEALNGEVLAKIRQCANTGLGLVMGAETFREQVRGLRS